MKMKNKRQDTVQRDVSKYNSLEKQFYLCSSITSVQITLIFSLVRKLIMFLTTVW